MQLCALFFRFREPVGKKEQQEQSFPRWIFLVVDRSFFAAPLEISCALISRKSGSEKNEKKRLQRAN